MLREAGRHEGGRGGGEGEKEEEEEEEQHGGEEEWIVSTFTLLFLGLP